MTAALDDDSEQTTVTDGPKCRLTTDNEHRHPVQQVQRQSILEIKKFHIIIS